MPEGSRALPTSELEGLCREIEQAWSGVLAAFQGFSTPRVEPEDTDCVVEVFFVDESDETSIIRGTYQRRKRWRRELGIHVGIVCHNSADSLSRYADDVSLLQVARLGVGAFTCANLSLTVNDDFEAVKTRHQVSVADGERLSDAHQPAYEIEDDLWQTVPEAA